jgi:hypothetical protein
MSPAFSRSEVESAQRAKAARLAPFKPIKKRSTKPTPKERDIQRAILAYLKLVPGVVAWRNNVGAVKEGTRFVRFGFPGLSDISGWVSRKALGPSCNCGATGLISHKHEVMVATPLYVEVKRPGTHPTAEQQAFLDSVKAAGGISVIARNVEDVRRALGLSN